MHGDSEDGTQQSNININKRKEVGSSTSASNEVACDLATPVATMPMKSPDMTRTTNLLVKCASKPLEDPL